MKMEDRDFVILTHAAIAEIGDAIKPFLSEGNRLMCSKPVNVQQGFAEVYISVEGVERRLLFPAQSVVMVSRCSPRAR